MKKLLFLAVLFSVLTLTTGAFAIPVTLTEGTGSGVYAYVGFYNPAEPSPHWHYNNYYTDYTAKIWYGDVAEPSALIGQFKAFCIDPAESNAQKSPTYDLVGVPNQAKYNEAAWLFQQYKSNTYSGYSVTDYQMAIWKTVLGANFWYSSPNSHVNTLVADAAGHGGFNASNFSIVSSPRNTDLSHTYGVPNQDFLIDYNVPEPSILVLIGMGMIALAGQRLTRGQRAWL